MENVSRDDWVLAGVALLLVIDLLFLPWFSIFGFTFSATSAPDGWLGVLAVLAGLAVIADLAVERLSPQTSLPAVQGSRSFTRLILAGVCAFFVVLKFLFHIHFSFFGFGFWAGAALTIALVVLALRAYRGQSVMSSGTPNVGGLR